MITFRTMRSDDIQTGLCLCRSANWNQLSSDWELFLKLSPGGCRVAVDESGKVVGTVTTVRYEDHFSWIGMVLVDPDRRRQGIGIKLLKESLRILQHENTIKLDATPAGREVYLKLDFRDEYYLSRMLCSSATVKVASETSVRPIKYEDLPTIFGYDHRIFGANRNHVLEWIWMGAPELAFVYERGNKVLGYCFGRRGYNYIHIGPVVAREELIAKELISAILANCSGKSVIIDAPHRSRSWLSWLEQNGFSEQRPFMRMFLGDNQWSGKPEQQFAILGPEFG